MISNHKHKNVIGSSQYKQEPEKFLQQEDALKLRAGTIEYVFQC